MTPRWSCSGRWLRAPSDQETASALWRWRHCWTVPAGERKRRKPSARACTPGPWRAHRTPPMSPHVGSAAKECLSYLFPVIQNFGSMGPCRAALLHHILGVQKYETMLALLKDAQDSWIVVRQFAPIPTPPLPRHGALAVLALMAILGGVGVALAMVTQLRYGLALGGLFRLVGPDLLPQFWESPSAVELFHRDMVLDTANAFGAGSANLCLLQDVHLPLCKRSRF